MFLSVFLGTAPIYVVGVDHPHLCVSFFLPFDLSIICTHLVPELGLTELKTLDVKDSSLTWADTETSPRGGQYNMSFTVHTITQTNSLSVFQSDYTDHFGPTRSRVHIFHRYSVSLKFSSIDQKVRKLFISEFNSS